MTTALVLLYLAGLSGTFTNLLIGAIFVTVIGCFGWALIMMPPTPTDDTIETLKRWARRWAWACGVILLLGIFYPSRDFLYLAAGLSVADEVAETQVAQKAYRLLNAELDDMLQEYGLEVEESE